MEKNIIQPGTTSDVIEKMSKFNDGKRSGYGHTLLALSRKNSFILVKDNIEYKTKTLKELKLEFEGYFIKTETWSSFTSTNKGKYVKGEHIKTIIDLLEREITRLNQLNKGLKNGSDYLENNIDLMWKYRNIKEYLEK